MKNNRTAKILFVLIILACNVAPNDPAERDARGRAPLLTEQSRDKFMALSVIVGVVLLLSALGLREKRDSSERHTAAAQSDPFFELKNTALHWIGIRQRPP